MARPAVQLMPLRQLLRTLRMQRRRRWSRRCGSWTFGQQISLGQGLGQGYLVLLVRQVAGTVQLHLALDRQARAMPVA